MQHSLQLPLLVGATAEQDALTREWAIRMGGLRVRVLPLGLPQELIHRADGALQVDARSITLQQSTSAVRLACPLLLDWSPDRRKAGAQWKQSTVAENGRILTAADATGLRWRIGDSQWLYYHDLDGSDVPRTVVGLHTFHETVLAELKSDGKADQLVQVENPLYQ